jgi:hypothetical protein
MCPTVLVVLLLYTAFAIVNIHLKVKIIVPFQDHQIFWTNMNEASKRKMQVLKSISLITISILKINSTFHFNHMS